MNKKSSRGDGGGPLVSVLVPIYNVEKYLRQCLASLEAQTLQDIEFICLNDGSTDNSPKIIQEFVKRDKRFKLLDKQNSGYGDSMNQGLTAANGKYIGIVESDDWAEPDMFEKLVNLAEVNKAQAVKSNFYFYVSRGGGSSSKFAIVDPNEVGSIINPRQTPHIFKGMSTIWSGLYNRQFLLDNKIDFLPTPGASYQDTAFNFKVWAAATRVVYTNDAYLHYRIDNESSSVKSRSKVFCVCDEFASIKEYLLDNNLMEQLKAVYTQRKFDIYFWNLTRLSGDNLTDFAVRMAEEFTDDQLNGYFDESLCGDEEKAILKAIIKNPRSYLRRRAVRHQLGRVYRLAGRTIGKINRSRVKRQSIINNLSGIFDLGNDLTCTLQSRIGGNNVYIDGVAETPIVSVIVPVYNAADFIARTLDSLINQTLDNIEIVCVDDGSTDDSLKILKKYAKNDKRIKVHHQQNAGVATARNTGLKYATGKYIMWCDSDDTYTPNMCLEMCDIMEQRHVDLAICSQNVVYDGIDKSLRKDTSSYLTHKYTGSQLIDWQLITNTDVSLWNKIFRRDIIEKNNIKFPDGLLFEDAYFCNAYMLMSKTIHFTDHKLYNYIRQPSSIMSTSFKKNKSSGDYLKITVATYQYLKEHNIYEQYADFFWLRMIQDYSYAKDNQNKDGKIEAQLFVREFIDSHYEDFQKATPGMQRAMWRVLRASNINKLMTCLKNVLRAVWLRISRRYHQQLKMLKLSNQVAGQARYVEYISGQLRQDRL